jgi:hypothetical protein
MRADRTFLVMRRGPMIGRPGSPPRISVYHRASNLVWALAAAVDGISLAARRGRRESYWIVKVGQPAHRTVQA